MLQQQLDSLLPAREFSRRDFVCTSVGSGFAAAVLPVVAQTTIKTDSTGLLAGEVTIPVGNFKMPAYRAAPLNKTNAPVVLVISEIFGVHEYIADVARRFAKQGYFAIAPELFVRQGDAQSYGEISKLIAEVVSKTSDAQVIGDLDATVAWAAQQGAAAQRLGITGFCWGGRIVWLYAAHNPALKAGVAWYGRLQGDVSADQPEARDRPGRLAEGAGAGPVRRPGRRHSAELGGRDAGRAGGRQPGGAALEVRGLPGCAACLPCRLPSQLPQGRGRGGLGAGAGLVQDPRRGLTGLLR